MKNNKEHKGVKITIAYALGNIFDKAIAFLTIPLFTSLLTTDDYGIVSTYLSWVGILTVLITLSLGNSIRTAVVDFPGEEHKFISSIFFVGSISFLVISSIILLMSLAFNFENYFLLIVCCCIHSYGSSIILTIQWKNMMKLEYIKRTLLQSLPNIVVVGLSVVFILLFKDNKYFGRILAYVVVFGLLSIFLVIFYFAKGKTFFNKKYIKYALSFSLPLIFHSLSSIILGQSDRLMITYLYNTSETGIYSLAYQFGMVPIVIMTTVENVWIPWFTKQMENNDRTSIKKMMPLYLSVVGIACVGLMLVAPEILVFMSTEDYYAAIPMIAPVIFAHFLIFASSIFIDYEYYKKHTIIISISTVVAALLNIILNFIFIPKFGGIAASYTTVASYSVLFLIHFFVGKRKEKDLFKTSLFMISTLIVSLFLVLTTILLNYSIARWLIAVSILISIIVFTFIFRKRLLALKGESKL